MDTSASQKSVHRPSDDDARSPETQDHNEYHQNGTLEPKSEESLESPPQPPPVDENIVGWDGPNDPKNPFTWSFKYKLFVSAVLNSLPLVVNIGSSILSDASRPLSNEYHVGTEVDILTITLFLLGFTFGPLIFGPLSEKFGRRWPILTGVTLFATFCLPVALAQNFQTIMISRFFSGLFGSSSMAITGGTLTDIWATPISRGIALDVFVTTGFIGPVIGPVVGSFITQSYLGWRWTMWVTAIVAYSFVIIAFFALPETYGPVLLTRKAGRLRYETKNWAIHSKMEEDRQDFQSLLRVYLLRPWGKQNLKLLIHVQLPEPLQCTVLLATEPILVLITLYLSFLYGLLFLFFEAYPISFQEDRHWKPQISALAFLGILVGNLLGLAGVVVHSLTIFARQIASTPGVLVPERRLPPMIVGAVLLPIGLFWFGWTSHPGTPWPAQVVAGIPVGAAMFVIFIQGFKYIVDVYLEVANSAISANTFVRSFFGAGFPLFAIAMYHTLGVDWASSLLGFLAIAMVPVPVVFYIWGSKIRSWSHASMS